MDHVPARCQSCVVRDTALCASLCDDDLVALSEIGKRRTVKAGETVTWEGDENSLCANVVAGALKLCKTTEDGKEQVVGLLFEGDFLGSPYASEGEMTAVALADTDLCVYPRGQFERVLDAKPKLERALLQRTLHSLNESRDRQLTLARRGAKARIAGLLFDIYRASGGTSITLPMARRDIADYLGLTIETVSRQFTDLRTDGIIDSERGSRTIRIVNPGALQALSED